MLNQEYDFSATMLTFWQGHSILRARGGLLVQQIALISLWLLWPMALLAQKNMTGLVINGTTGRPIVGQKVELLALGEEMRATAETQSGKDGSFTFALKETPGAPHILLQTLYHGISYNVPVMSSNLAAPAQINVYETTRDASQVKVSLPVMLAQASGNALLVQQLYLVENKTMPAKTLVDPNGTFFFDLPPAAQLQDPSVLVVGSSGIPLPQTPMAKSGGGYLLNYAMKPGETEIRVSYRVNSAGNIRELRHRLFYSLESSQVLILPANLKASAVGLQRTGTDPNTQAAAYQLGPMEKGSSLDLKVEGSAPEVDGAAAGETAAASTQEEQRFIHMPNEVYEKRGIILGVLGVFLLLMLGFALHPSSRKEPGSDGPEKGQA